MTEGEPGEVEEFFQYELIKTLKKIQKTLEHMNENLELIRKKELGEL
jgi:hypothetical protein